MLVRRPHMQNKKGMPQGTEQLKIHCCNTKQNKGICLQKQI